MKATIALPEIDLGYLPAFLAQTEGIFNAEGLEVELIAMRGAREGVEALVNSQVDFAMSIGPALPFIWGGADLRVLVQMTNCHVFHLIAQHDIEAIDDLSEKKIGVGFGGMTFFLARQLFNQRQKAIFVNIPGGGAKLAALKEGSIDACFLPAPFHLKALDARRAGLKELALEGRDAQMLGLPFTGLLARDNYVRTHQNTVARMVRSLLLATNQSRNNGTTAINVMTCQLEMRPGEAKKAYRKIRGCFNPMLQEEDVRRMAEMVATCVGKDLKGVDRRYTDLQFLQAAGGA